MNEHVHILPEYGLNYWDCVNLYVFENAALRINQEKKNNLYLEEDVLLRLNTSAFQFLVIRLSHIRFVLITWPCIVFGLEHSFYWYSRIWWRNKMENAFFLFIFFPTFLSLSLSHSLFIFIDIFLHISIFPFFCVIRERIDSMLLSRFTFRLCTYVLGRWENLL